MNALIATLRRLRPGARKAPAEAAATLPPAEPLEEGADARPLGCGWFDSSHELHRGLVVHEHASADTLGSELPLASWLELQLSGWRAPQTALPAV